MRSFLLWAFQVHARMLGMLGHNQLPHLLAIEAGKGVFAAILLYGMACGFGLSSLILGDERASLSTCLIYIGLISLFAYYSSNVVERIHRSTFIPRATSRMVSWQELFIFNFICSYLLSQ